jgi:uncharacterized protein
MMKTGAQESDEPPMAEFARLSDLTARLEAFFGSAGSVVVALSGGVDSALVAAMAGRTLGSRALAVTGVSPSYPDVQRAMVESVVGRFSLEHAWVRTNEIEDERYARNAPDRCYFCKSELYTRLTSVARDRGFSVVVDGTNVDDLSDHRPGRIAAEELGVRSPLVESGAGKRDVRAMARALDVPVWDAPASACLASRIPHGTPVTIARLGRVERAEAALRGLGFRQVRVRHHEDIARIELAPEEMSAALDVAMARAMSEAVRAAGFQRIVLDLDGYRSRE